MNNYWKDYVKVDLKNFKKAKNNPQVVHIVIDGVNNEFLYNSYLKNIGPIINNGFYFQKCYSIFPTLTGPAHTSMNSGALPIDTTVNLNMYYNFEQNKLIHVNPLKYSKVESIAETLNRNEKKTAGICGHMNRGLNYFVSESYLGHDANKITDYGIKALEEFSPDYIQLVYFTVDTIQHYYGPKSNEASESLKWVDKEIGRLLNFVKKQNENVNIIISADHGQDKIKNNISEQLYGIIQNCGYDYYGYGRFVVIEETEKRRDKKKLIEKLHNEVYIKNILWKDELQKLGVDPKKVGKAIILLDKGYSTSSEYKGDHGSYTEEEALVPLVFYGPNIKKGSSDKSCEIIDIVSTITDILNTQEPKNNQGEILKSIYGEHDNIKKSERVTLLRDLLKS